MVYVAKHEETTLLYLRPMDSFTAEPMPGTEGGYGPFFSPQGDWLGFFSGNQMKKVALRGGQPVTICEVSDAQGASWGEDDTIIFSDAQGVALIRISAQGGTPGSIPHLASASSLSPDGKVLAYDAEPTPETKNDIWLSFRSKERLDEQFLATPDIEWGAQFSPDGRHIAYTSDESGRSEAYVQPYPPTGERWQISDGGGEEPIWSQLDGRDLYNRSEIYSGFEAGVIFWPLPECARHGICSIPRCKKMFADQRQRPATSESDIFVVNWAAELEDLTSEGHTQTK